MTRLILRADFDRSGRSEPSDDAARHQLPGAILLADLDVEGRSLPGGPTVRRRVVLDADRSNAPRGDDELLRLSIRGVWPSNARLSLLIQGTLGPAVDVLGNARRRLRVRRTGDGMRVELARGAADLWLRARTLPQSPTYSYDPRRGDPVSYGWPAHLQASTLLILLQQHTRTGTETLDAAFFTVAPVLLTHNVMPAERLYIASAADNQPSRMDVHGALARSGVRVLSVRSGGDAWLQDQILFGYCHGPAGVQRMLVHLPRMRSNVVDVGSGRQLGRNLAAFVRGHFPSRDFGLFEDFWEREVDVVDQGGRSHTITFRQSYLLFRLFADVQRFRQLLLRHYASFQQDDDEPAERALPGPSTFAALVAGLPAAVRRLESLLGDRHPQLAEQLRARLRALGRRIAWLGTEFAVNLPRVLTARLSVEGMNELNARIQQLHSGANYGGNIAASPPAPGAPHGKIVLGHAGTSYGSDENDPDMTLFLQRQGVQPVLRVNTAWLMVGHTDEVLAFLPHRGHAAGFAVAHADPGLAMSILRACWRRHLAGLSSSHQDATTIQQASYASQSRLTNEGSSPVTHLLRGQFWLHSHPPGADFGLEPPLIYQHHAAFTLRVARQVTGHQALPLWFGPDRRDRHYPANLSVRELLHFERTRPGAGESVNGVIDETFTGSAPEYLQNEFSGVPVVALPVLFDTVGDVRGWRGESDAEWKQTTAFIPNMVNLQVVNTRLLVPRPYGPRMSIDDARWVLETVLREQHSPLAGRVSRRFLQGLAHTHYWIHPRSNFQVHGAGVGGLASLIEDSFGGTRSLADVARRFSDGFPGQTLEEVMRRIREANARSGAFEDDGELRPGWHKLAIPENNVDLFEAYGQLVLEALGLTVHWVDSWFYHVRLGQIHCGTKVVRRVEPGALGRPWWNDRRLRVGRTDLPRDLPPPVPP